MVCGNLWRLKVTLTQWHSVTVKQSVLLFKFWFRHLPTHISCTSSRSEVWGCLTCMFKKDTKLTIHVCLSLCYFKITAESIRSNIITKLPQSGDLYGNITEFGVVEEHLSPQGESDLPPPQTKWYCNTVHQTKVFFNILLFNGLMSFYANIYEINMYLLLYFIFLNNSVGIYPTATQKSHKQHSNAIHVTSWWLMTS